MNRNDTIEQNAVEVNGFLAKLYLWLLLIPILLVLVKYMGIIRLSWTITTVAAGISTAAGLIPAVCKVADTESSRMRYYVLLCSFADAVVLYLIFDKTVLLIWLLPLIIGFLYVDMALVSWSAGSTVMGIATVEIVKRLLLIDTGFNSQVMFYILIALQILLFASVITKAVSGTNKMLNNIQSLYDNINGLITNAAITSESLFAAENSFLLGMKSSNLDKGEIITDPDNELTNNRQALESVTANIDIAIANTKELLNYNQEIALASKDSPRRKKDIKKDIKEMEQYAEKSKTAIESLVKNTEKVKQSIGLMSVIVDESCLISMKASLEAARAEDKDENADKALHIKALADKTADSAFDLKETLKDIVADADFTVKSVNDTYTSVAHSLDIVNRTVETLIKGLMLKKMH